MSVDKKLQLIFTTDNGKTHTLTIDTPVEPVDVIAVNNAITAVLSNPIISGKNGSLVAIKEVNFITRTVDAVTLA